MDQLRVAIFQQATIPGGMAANVERIAAAATEAAADVCITPELSFTGYDVRDAAPDLAMPLPLPRAAALEPLRSTNGILVAGLIESVASGLLYNSAVVLDHGEAVAVHRKIYLPTYGMFDELRFFARGRSLDPVEIRGWRVGVLICEDFWHPGLVYTLAAAGIDALFVLAAGPGRGVWEGGEHGDFASADVWEAMVRTTAMQYGIYVALANRVGVERGVTFAGGSVIADPSGRVLTRGPSHEEAVLHATFTRAELQRARRPYFHGRDDDPSLVLRELARLTAAAGDVTAGAPVRTPSR